MLEESSHLRSTIPFGYTHGFLRFADEKREAPERTDCPLVLLQDLPVETLVIKTLVGKLCTDSPREGWSFLPGQNPRLRLDKHMLKTILAGSRDQGTT